MAAIILPSRFTQQPQYPALIDGGNTLTSGLVLANLPGLHRGFDLATSRSSTIVGVKSTPTHEGITGGFGATHGQGTTDRVTTSFVGALTERSYFFRFRRNGTGGGALGRLFDKTNGTTGQFLAWNSGSVVTYTYYAGAAQRDVLITGSGASGVWFDVLITHRVSGTTHSGDVYLDGRFVTSFSLTAALNDASATALTIGNRASDSARVWDGLISCGYVWNRILTTTEASSLHNNPWQIFRAPVRRLLVDIAAPGGGFQPYWAMNSNLIIQTGNSR